MKFKGITCIKWFALIFILWALIFHVWNHNWYSKIRYHIKPSLSNIGNSTLNPPIYINMTFVHRRNHVHLRIIVITYNRAASLERLLNSLNDADYLNHKVVIEIWIDRSKRGIIHAPTYTVAKHFIFRKGLIDVFNHSTHVGLYGQWIGLWQPSSDSTEIAVILEDDLTVSPYFYRYLMKAHRTYGRMKDINGYSLQCSMKHSGANGKLQAPYNNVVFKYPIIGTWGFSPRNENWLNFTKWYKIQSLKKGFYPLVPGIKPSIWYKEFIQLGKTDSMWTMWHIYYAWSNKEYTLYPNLPNCDAFSVNWREIGLHYKIQSNVTDSLMLTWDIRFDHLPENPVCLNTYGNVIK